MTDEFDKPMLRAVQYHYIDGTFELTFGGICLLLGFFFFIQNAMPQNFLSGLLMMSLVLVIPGVALLKNKLIGRFKEKVTYPRTGYVSYRKMQDKDRNTFFGLNLAVRVIIAAVIVLLISLHPNTQDWVPVFTAFFFAFMLSWLGFRSMLKRFHLLGMLVFLSGIIFSYIRLGNASGLSLFYATSGLILLVSGVMTLRKYLQANPQPGQERNES